jgi:acrylyl-CoA reductase (NADPH)
MFNHRSLCSRRFIIGVLKLLEMKHRELVWNKLAQKWKLTQLSDTCQEITLDQLSEKIGLMLQGKLKGRIVVKMEQ